MADITPTTIDRPKEPAPGAGMAAWTAYQAALKAYTDAQTAKAQAAKTVAAKIAQTPAQPAPYTPVDTTGKPVAPVSRVEPPKQAPYQSMLAGVSASTPFAKPGQTATTTSDEDIKVARGQAAEKAALAAGKSPQEAKAAGLEAYMSYTGPEKTISPTQFSAPKEYAPGEQRTGVENPALYPDKGTVPAASPPVGTEKSRADKVASVMTQLAKEGNDKPNLADIIEAAASGWNHQTSAYSKKQAAKQEAAQRMAELTSDQSFRTALSDKEIAAQKELAGLKLGALGSLTPGKKLAIEALGLGG